MNENINLDSIDQNEPNINQQDVNNGQKQTFDLNTKNLQKFAKKQLEEDGLVGVEAIHKSPRFRNQVNRNFKLTQEHQEIQRDGGDDISSKKMPLIFFIEEVQGSDYQSRSQNGAFQSGIIDSPDDDNTTNGARTNVIRTENQGNAKEDNGNDDMDEEEIFLNH